jgi:CheY-like chemotaxis protein
LRLQIRAFESEIRIPQFTMKPVLIIEDDPDIAEGVRFNLEREGLEARGAATGEEGLAAALDAARPPALVILDLMLPGMSGMELCRRLRREPATRRTPIIMLTARVDETDRVAGLDLGADDCITGPFSVKELMAHGRQVEAKVERAARERRAYDLRVAPLKPRDGWGARRGAVGVFFDITRLERLERVRQEFLSNVSHELRTPLTAIRAFVETLESGVVDDPEHNRRFLSIIDRNAARMHSLIDDILELSAIESGKAPVEPQPVRLRVLAQEVLTSLANRASERRRATQRRGGRCDRPRRRAASNRC